MHNVHCIIFVTQAKTVNDILNDDYDDGYNYINIIIKPRSFTISARFPCVDTYNNVHTSTLVL